MLFRILNAQDRETYRRWLRIIAVTYASAILCAVAAAAVGSQQPEAVASPGHNVRHPG